jgi:hypothetical protein
MQRRTNATRFGFAALAMLIAVLMPAGVFAHDGEVISDGINAVGNIYVSGGRVRVTVNNLGDCPPAVTGCWIEAAWYDKGTSPFDCCFSNRSGWFKVPVGADTVPSYCDHGNHFWELRLRLHVVASTQRTIEAWGEMESFLNVDGSIGYRALAKDLYVRGYGGYRGRVGQSSQMGIQTAADAIFVSTIASTSGGNWLATNAC